MKEYKIALDGPAGSGKSTIAKIIAKNFNFTYLDTGAMYRMVTLYVIENNIDINNQSEIEKMFSKIKLDIVDEKFLLNDVDVSKKIRTPEVTNLVSHVSSIKTVRTKLVDLQRKISEGKNVILDGRDIGTVVFPNAQLKMFLVASPEERAKRRVLDFSSQGINQDYEVVLKDILERDKIDSTRAESPLKKANDSIEIDTSTLSIEDTVDKISNLIKELGE